MSLLRDAAQVSLSMIASGNGHGEESSYFDGWKAYESDPYHPTSNPHGVIQMGLAENQLSCDLIQEWVLKHPESSICTAQGVKWFCETANFQDYHGLEDCRNGIANFMGKVRGNGVAFDPERIVMCGGATGAHEIIAFCLADRGDAFLVPTPYYPGFDRDLRWRTGVRLLPVPCDSSNDFTPTPAALEAAYLKARAANIRVKGLLITNPSNPLGTVYDRPTLESLLRFAAERRIHFICDEIYAGTVFAHPTFTSVAEILNTSPSYSSNPDLVHIIYSLSKDLGLPGFRVGVIYSYNDVVVRCARRMSSFGLVSSQTQRLLGSMLQDEEFVEGFLRESSRRLGARHGAFVRGLSRVGIECLRSSGGLFLWLNLKGMLREATVEAETALWRVIIQEVKLNVSPGSSFHCSEPGWFRVCFANMDDATVLVALRRIEAFVGEGVKTAKKACRRQNSLKLSLSGSRRFEDPMMSPYSPIPHSPLVPARN